MLTLLCSKVGLNHGINKCMHIQLPKKISHLEENSNKKQHGTQSQQQGQQQQNQEEK